MNSRDRSEHLLEGLEPKLLDVIFRYIRFSDTF